MYKSTGNDINLIYIMIVTLRDETDIFTLFQLNLLYKIQKIET